MTAFENSLAGDIARVVARCGGDPITFKTNELEHALSSNIDAIQMLVLRQLPDDFTAERGMDSITFGRKGRVKEHSFQRDVKIYPPRR